ncbi:M24 family metallopeptidase [Phaeobacter inhibens]|uniref:M24 family metallopeptidase n=1 Tax=Phaeobacter inhibens TaxID=221822 RepID=UPI0021A28DCF|nr:Xaa-Pro peptidase family protein [Phaeobacter inhibens]UWR49193.1 Xaa-Pro peptidase family protein [Phaeobacter inhibens]
MLEHQTRFSALEEKIKKAGLDAFLISTKDSIFYFTGFRYEPFERPFFIVVRPGKKPIFLTPRIEAENMATIAVPHQIVEYIDYPAPAGGSYIEALQTVLPDNADIGVEMSITGELMVALSSWSPQVLPYVEQLRMVKSPHEIAAIRKAARYSDRGLQLAMDLACHGGRIADTDKANAFLREEIAQKEGYLDPYISNIWQGIWAAPYSAQPHRFPEPSDTLIEGPNVGLSFLRVNGYSAETERTFFVTSPRKEDAEVFNTMVEAGKIGFAALRPGVSCHDVDHKVMEFLRAEGFGNNLLHRTGHGIGMGGHEGPWVAEGSDDVLQENMVISIEPGIYWRGQGGFRHSDTVLITNDGYEMLTDMPHDIASMTLGS